MARSPLLGGETVPTQARGRDSEALGPSDTSDSGSDVAGIDDTDDPGQPVDAALGQDRQRSFTSPDALSGDTDRSGTGERAAAAGDSGGPDGADVRPDRIVGPDGEVGDAADVESLQTDEDDDESED